MKKRTIGATIAGVALAVGIAGGAVALAGGDSEGSPPSNPQEQRAVAAALAETGGGEANAVERDGEKGATWEVEVAKADGSTVDVRLDGNLHVIAVDADQENAGNGR
jgi:Peptidase propeptide and YPEB domain